MHFPRSPLWLKAADDNGGAAKKPKKEAVDLSATDVQKHATEGTLKKLTVPALKAFLTSVKLKPKTKKVVAGCWHAAIVRRGAGHLDNCAMLSAHAHLAPLTIAVG